MTLTTEPAGTEVDRMDVDGAELSAELVRKAEALVEFVAEEAAETERRGSVSAEAIEAFCDAGS